MNTRISVELVPRTEESLNSEILELKAISSVVDTVNVPDILRFKMRSWEAAQACSPHFAKAIPHIRSIDFHYDELSSKLVPLIMELGLKEVLIVSGDMPQDLGRRVYHTSPLDAVRVLKQHLPELKVYGAIDPYRSGLHTEFDYVKRKAEAGFDGFFTQPLFDLRFLEVISEQTQHLNVFWGVTPVLSEGSRNYWETRNRAFFPKDFKPELEWNRNFASRVLEFCRSTEQNIYFMPIRVSLTDYLGGILS